MDGNKASVQSRTKLQLMVAGGGTGGHLFPGIAIAEEVLARNRDNRIRFIGTGNPFETATLNSKGFAQEIIRIQGVKGRRLLKQVGALLEIPGSITQSIRILRKFRPNLVLGLGGYSSGPVVVGAWLLGIPTVLHEQNILPGITNRLLAGFADRIYISFEHTQFKRFQQKLRLTGNPVRKEFLENAQKSVPVEENEQKQVRSIFSVFIIGGSQGAHRVNTAVIESLRHLRDRSGYEFIHQTGAADEAWVKEAYSASQIRSTVRAFFDDMVTQYRRADMVVCRAGATTIAELSVMGKGVVFIPYPYAANDHQALNAASLVSQNAAEMILEKNLNGKMLAEKIETYASSPTKLRSMALKAKASARPWAAKMIVDDMYHLTGIKDSRIRGVECNDETHSLYTRS